MNTLKELSVKSQNPKAELDRLRKLAAIRLGRNVGVNEALSDDEIITLMAPAKRGRKKGAVIKVTPKEVLMPASPAVVRRETSRFVFPRWKFRPATIARVLISVGLSAIPVGHGYLLYYDSSELFGRAGQIGGLIYLLFIVVGTVMAFDKRNGAVADIFVWAIGILDIFAFFIHYEVFSRTLSGLSSVFITIYCVFIVSASFFSLLALRNYDVVEEIQEG